MNKTLLILKRLIELPFVLAITLTIAAAVFLVSTAIAVFRPKDVRFSEWINATLED